jgi:tRNA(fMet)-specific endonuclease VapC
MSNLTTSRYLLDTNAAIALINRQTTVEQMVGDADVIFVSAITLGELYFGAEYSGRVADNVREVDTFAEKYAILNPDTQTAGQYGKTLGELRRKGRPIPQNDIWIAATAIQYKLTLLTRDQHFNVVDGLAVQAW